jgi:hypothetical protein
MDLNVLVLFLVRKNIIQADARARIRRAPEVTILGRAEKTVGPVHEALGTPPVVKGACECGM